MNKIFPKLVRQIFHFGVVGVIAASVHFSMVVLLVQGLDWAPLVANIFGFLTGFQVTYWGNRLWTFNGTEISHRSAFPKLLLVQIIMFAANETLFYSFLLLNLPYPLALLIVLLILPAFTFASSKLWVFK